MGFMSLKSVAELVQERVSKEWDLVIGITGEEGVGKSTLAILLSKLIDPRFDLVKNVAYLPTYDEVQGKFYALKPKQVFLVDEAIKVLYKLRWADKFQIELNEMYATERYQTKVTILCMPRFLDFNERFRNHRIKIWIHVFGRGRAAVFIKDDINIYASDPWYTKENYKMLVKSFKKARANSLEEKLSVYEKAKNFSFFIQFPMLEPADELRYKELKAKARTLEPEQDDRVRTVINKRNDLLYWLSENAYMKQDDGTYRKIYDQELAKAYGMATGTISEILKAKKAERAAGLLT